MIVIKDKFMVCLLRKFIIYGLFLLIVLVIFFDLKAWKSLNDEEKQNVRKKDIMGVLKMAVNLCMTASMCPKKILI